MCWLREIDALQEPMCNDVILQIDMKYSLEEYNQFIMFSEQIDIYDHISKSPLVYLYINLRIKISNEYKKDKE